jgi:Protein of unknown function (DUF4435)
MIPLKRTIDEVKVRLKCEPTVREIYVEGLYDRDFFRWVLKQLGLSDVKVYPISTVNVPDELVLEKGMTLGERQRVIVAASSLEDLTDVHARVLFLIDADLDYMLERAKYNPPLLATDGTSAELMIWKNCVLEKFAAGVLGADEPAPYVNALMDFVEKICLKVFEFRVAKERLQKNWKLIDVDDSFGRKVEFSFNEYCEKVLSKNNAMAALSKELPGALKDVAARASELPVKKKLHGHDVFRATARKLKIDGYKQSCLEKSEEFERILMSCVDWSMISSDETVAAIRSKFSQ